MNKEQNLKKITSFINQFVKEKPHLLLAIDGRCAAGKTSLAESLQDIYKCNVIHMDQFFLRGEQRSEERLKLPGENIDHERFLEEVLIPLRTGQAFSYRPYNCKLQEFEDAVSIQPNAIHIIEGSYSCHKNLWDYYDLRVFMTVNEGEQIRRIEERNGSGMCEMFKRKWIPLEENYFAAYDIASRCDIYLET